MHKLLPFIREKKEVLDAYARVQPTLSSQFQEWTLLEFVYTTNLIEGSSLSRSETRQVISKGLAIGGKTLAEQNNAVTYAQAVDWLRRSASISRHNIDEQLIISMHHFPSSIDNSGGFLRYTYQVPYVLTEFTEWLRAQQGTEVEVAVRTFSSLLELKPFIDSNVRTARLLFELLMLMDGYPLVVTPEDKVAAYGDAVEQMLAGASGEAMDDVLYESILFSLDACLNSIEAKPSTMSERLLKIGQLAKTTGETIPTIRHWTKRGLLQVAAYSEGGYQMYDPAMAEVVMKIRELQREKRMTIKEIREEMGKKLVIGNEADK